MTAISDAVVIGVVLGLVFAAVSYYLFSRISQLERKVSFMETILLELKVTTEQTLLSATEPPEAVAAPTANDLNTYNEVVEQTVRSSDQGHGEIKQIRPFATVEDSGTSFQPMESETRELVVESAPRARTPQQSVQVERDSSRQSVSENFEAMTYKELQAYAREHNISGIRNLSKKEVIDIIRRRISGGAATGPAASSSPDVTDLSSWKQSSVQESESNSAFQPLQDTDDLGAMVGSDETQPHPMENIE
jgi:hypothetical protein